VSATAASATGYTDAEELYTTEQWAPSAAIYEHVNAFVDDMFANLFPATTMDSDDSDDSDSDDSDDSDEENTRGTNRVRKYDSSSTEDEQHDRDLTKEVRQILSKRIKTTERKPVTYTNETGDKISATLVGMDTDTIAKVIPHGNNQIISIPYNQLTLEEPAYAAGGRN
jgi:hypothetical protein